jgi:3-deoxy-7-phosphoheptulonate synthase
VPRLSVVSSLARHTHPRLLIGLIVASRSATFLSVATSPPPSSTFSTDKADWDPSSWQKKQVSQGPKYEDEAELKDAVDTLKGFSPLVFAGEVRSLHEQLARAASGQGFLLMGGDCAEAFDEFNVDHVRDTFRVMLQMGLVMTFGSAMPVIKVGRMAGQFAKPRSEPDEVQGDVALPSYRGDIINREAFTEESRRHNPHNMVGAYHQSAQTLNILRAFSTGGYADISRLHAWNLDFVEQTTEGSRYVITRDCSFWCRYRVCFVCGGQLNSHCFASRLILTATVNLPPRWTNLCVS